LLVLISKFILFLSPPHEYSENSPSIAEAHKGHRRQLGLNCIWSNGRRIGDGVCEFGDRLAGGERDFVLGLELLDYIISRPVSKVRKFIQ
jgi:hypothetical protein